jgi:O-antigen chain-terminating methyltransferase
MGATPELHERRREKTQILNPMTEVNKSVAETESNVPADVSVLHIPALELQPGTESREAERYQLDELSRYHDRAFVANAYAALCKRAPTDTELKRTLDDLRSGQRGKVEIIESLLAAQTGGAPRIHVEGLPSPLLRRVSRWPLFGYTLRLLRDLRRLPLLIRHQQQFEAYTMAQQQHIADYLNDVLAPAVKRPEEDSPVIAGLSATVADAVESVMMLSDSLVELSGRQAELQAQLQNLQRLQAEPQDLQAQLQHVRAEHQNLQAHLQNLQAQREQSEALLHTNLVALTEALTAQQQQLDEARRAQATTANAQQEFLVQEQRVIVETQKAVLAEIQERLDELQQKYQQNRVALLSQERRLLTLNTGAQPQPAASGSESPLPTTEPAHGGEAEGLNLDSLYASFEDQFRGARSAIKAQLKFYLPLLRAARVGTVERPVLDVGCGRGEWLELLREEGLHARGVDANGVLVEQCAARGLDVAKTDALTYLRALAEDSLSALTGFHIIEHLPFLALVELLDETLRVLRPGGLVILETPNPKNLVVGACNFYSDPTHLRPLFPETLKFLLDQRGFAQVRVEYLHPVDNGPVWQAEPAAQALYGWFYGPRDFAVIGSKA